MRKSDPTANVRMYCLTTKTMDELLKDLLVEITYWIHLIRCTMLTRPLDHRAPKIVAGRGHKKVPRAYRPLKERGIVTAIIARVSIKIQT